MRLFGYLLAISLAACIGTYFCKANNVPGEHKVLATKKRYGVAADKKKWIKAPTSASPLGRRD